LVSCNCFSRLAIDIADLWCLFTIQHVFSLTIVSLLGWGVSSLTIFFMGSLEPCPTHMDCFQYNPIEIGEQSRADAAKNSIYWSSSQVTKYTKEEIRLGKSAWEKNENPTSPCSESSVGLTFVQQVSISSNQSLFFVYFFFFRAISTRKSSLISSSLVYPFSSVVQWFSTTIIVVEPRSPSSDRCTGLLIRGEQNLHPHLLPLAKKWGKSAMMSLFVVSWKCEIVGLRIKR
jgi:hypothetical protein